MEIKIKFENFDKTDVLCDYVNKKLANLTKFNSKITAIDVTLNLAKGGEQNAKANLYIPGEMLHAHANSTDLYSSINQLEHKLAEQLKKHHDKLMAHRH